MSTAFRSPVRVAALSLAAMIPVLGACSAGDDAARTIQLPEPYDQSSPMSDHPRTASLDLPPLDHDAPAAFATATFALG